MSLKSGNKSYVIHETRQSKATRSLRVLIHKSFLFDSFSISNVVFRVLLRLSTLVSPFFMDLSEF